MEKELKQNPQQESAESLERRELVAKLGKFALYAAPFTVLAYTKKAAAATGAAGGGANGGGGWRHK